MMKTIKVKYYASLREQANQSEEKIETDAVTAKDLYEQLKIKYEFNMTDCQLKVAVNNSFSEMNYELKAGDELVFIPPVAGG